MFGLVEECARFVKTMALIESTSGRVRFKHVESDRPTRSKFELKQDQQEMHSRLLLADDVAGIARVHRRACLIAYKFMNWSYSEDEVRLVC